LARKEKKGNEFKDLGSILDAGYQEVALKKQELSTAGQQAKVEAVRKADIKENDAELPERMKSAISKSSNLDALASNHRNPKVREMYEDLKSKEAAIRDALEELRTAKDEERAIAAMNLFRARMAHKKLQTDIENYANEIGDLELAGAARDARDGWGEFDAGLANAMKLHVFDTPSWKVTVEQQRFNEWYNSVFLDWKLYGNLMAAELTPLKTF